MARRRNAETQHIHVIYVVSIGKACINTVKLNLPALQRSLRTVRST